MRIIYRCKKKGSGGGDEYWCCVDTMKDEGISLYVGDKDIYPWAIAFSADGTQLYVVGYNTDTIYQYTLSTAWALATASYTAMKSVSAEESQPRGIAFSADGTKMYISGTGSDAVKQYALSTAWDVTSAVYASKMFSTAAQTTNPYSIFFSPDGTKMYIGSWTATRGIFQYALSTAWDVSTASYTGNYLDLLATVSDIYVKSDGKKIYIMRNISSSVIFQYKMTTDWDLSTAAFECYYNLGENGQSMGLFFSSNGGKVYTCGYNSKMVKQYKLCGITISEVYYGLLYNWYAVSDARKITSSDEWIVPSLAETTTLANYLGGETVAGGKLKTTGTTYWTTPNTGATNEVGFNAKGTGIRGSDGVFSFFKQRMWYNHLLGNFSNQSRKTGFLYNSAAISNNFAGAMTQGATTRLVKTSTSLSHGQEGIYTGNDGKSYKTICIGTQEWLAENLIETKFRNGDIIPWHGANPVSYFTNAEWMALTSAGVCAYNNDLTLVAPGFSFPT